MIGLCDLDDVVCFLQLRSTWVSLAEDSGLVAFLFSSDSESESRISPSDRDDDRDVMVYGMNRVIPLLLATRVPVY